LSDKEKFNVLVKLAMSSLGENIRVEAAEENKHKYTREKVEEQKECYFIFVDR
jgi:hypothetical protein